MNKKSKITDELLATIVLYNTSLDQSMTFNTLSRSLETTKSKVDIFVYDNSASKMYSGETYHHWNIHYHHDPLNSGISKAYNTACTLAKKLNKKWLLLLDQDTSFPENAFSLYAKALIDKPSTLYAPILISNGKIISPFKPEAGTGRIPKAVEPGAHSYHRIMPVNSGILVNVASFESCGGYNEAFPLDYSDFAFIERFKNIAPTFEVINLVCQQQFSGLETGGNKTATLKRFMNFCEATINYKVLINPDLNTYRTIFKRAVKLTVAYKSPIFIKAAFTALQNRK